MQSNQTNRQNTPSVVQDGGTAAASGFSMGKSLFAEKPESLYQVKRIRCGNVNCWLVTGSKALPTNGSVLVDAGRKEDFPRLEQICRQHQVKLILLTHAHPDHAGSAALLRKSLRIPVALGRLDLPLLEHPQHPAIALPGLAGKGFAGPQPQGTGSAGDPLCSGTAAGRGRGFLPLWLFHPSDCPARPYSWKHGI